jgi:dimethylargininase
VFRHAIVRPPAANFADGLTTATLGAPDVSRALDQHARYCEALEGCGLALTRLHAEPRFPDSTFVEDTAILTARGAVLTRPGAPSREGEVAGIAQALSVFFAEPLRIEPPGTVDGGDVCEAGHHFFIGVSRRTNAEGARQLADHLRRLGYTSVPVDVRGVAGILHLKSGLAAVDDRRLVVIEALAERAEFEGYERLVVDVAETYAANCVRVNEALLVAGGHPRFEASARRLGLDVITLEMSEFEKMDGGLSCLSLRF